MSNEDRVRTGSHWGMGLVSISDGVVTRVDAHPDDPHPSPINENIASSLSGRARVLRPAVRKGWLTGGGIRGRDDFVEVSWEDALDLLGTEISRIRTQHGNKAIYGGSYGWSSAGRFHHAQGQLKRFLNTQGGFVRSKGNYSYNAALVLMPHIVGRYRDHVATATRWSVVAEHTNLVVAFGGLPLRNTQVGDGGVSKHRMKDSMTACAKSGVRFVSFSPLRTDVSDMVKSEWLPPRPGSDVAVMMGLAHTLLVENLHDKAFLKIYTTGFAKVEAYLLGHEDGTAKDADWAATQSGVDAGRIRALARDMAASRTMITCSAGLQRADFGEQPLWMTVTLAAMLGQIGLPGGGYTIGYAVNATIGNTARPFRPGVFPQGENPVDDFIPVAMISEMLLNPRGSYKYNGQTRHFPDIRMVWWAGGNPFHHHQDLRQLHAALQKPETVVVNEINWTATARHADIVLPVAAPQERIDFGAGHTDSSLMPMPQAVLPAGEAWTEFEMYAALAEKLGNAEAFTEGLTPDGWIRRMWDETRQAANACGPALPDWDTFIDGDVLHLPDPAPNQVFLADFRADPIGNALPTPSGRIELYSDVIAGFDLPDCPGHASWLPRRDAGDADHPLFLISGQPATRLHSQLDNGAYSLGHKIAGREPVLIHPDDARTRGIEDGDVVELFNARGRCLAGARLTDDIAPGSVFLWTGAWYDPDYSALQDRDRHGNPNVLTHDLRTSALSQGPAAHSARVELARFDAKPPKVMAHEPPEFATSEEDAVGQRKRTVTKLNAVLSNA